MEEETYKVKIQCDNCEKVYDIEIVSLADLPQKCKKCGKEDVWYMDIKFSGEETSPPVLGGGGCGGR